MSFINWLIPFINQLGDWIYVIMFLTAFLESTAFVGLLVPGAALIIFFGFLGFLRVVYLPDVLWIMALGGIAGDAISFYLGGEGNRFFSPQGKILSSKHLLTAEDFFKRHGAKSVVIARFIGPLRPIVPFVAGLFKMPAKKFFLFNIPSGLAASLVYVGAGFVFGHAWARLVRAIGQVGISALIFIAGTLLAGYIVRKKTLRL